MKPVEVTTVLLLLLAGVMVFAGTRSDQNMRLSQCQSLNPIPTLKVENRFALSSLAYAFQQGKRDACVLADADAIDCGKNTLWLVDGLPKGFDNPEAQQCAVDVLENGKSFI